MSLRSALHALVRPLKGLVSGIIDVVLLVPRLAREVPATVAEARGLVNALHRQAEPGGALNDALRALGRAADAAAQDGSLDTARDHGEEASGSPRPASVPRNSSHDSQAPTANSGSPMATRAVPRATRAPAR